MELVDADLRIDVYRSTGPGGQSVNTTDSAVRITHLPTGVVVAMQDEKSQIQNRAKAIQVLRARLLKLEQDKQADELSRQRREQVGGGGRSEKIRTYNFKENRVTDHRIGLTLHKLDRVLQGDLDELVDALMADKRARQLERCRRRRPVSLAAGVTRGALVAELAALVGAPHEARFIVDEALGLGVALGHPCPPTGRSTTKSWRRRGPWRHGGRRGSRCNTSSVTGPSARSTCSWTRGC